MTKSFPLRIPIELYEIIRHTAYDSRVSMNKLMGEILAEYFGKMKRVS